jgi:CheY-like chemotaxis protein
VESRQQVGSTFCLHLPMRLGAELPTQPQLPAVNANLYTRRHSLADSLQRHCAGLGIPLTWDPAAQEIDSDVAGPVLVDASTHEPLLLRCLAKPDSLRAKLVVIATPAEAERLDLRILLPESAVILKPVHQVALREALATVLGMTELVAPSIPQREQIETMRGHVLLVEDEAVNAAVAQGYLAEIGCSCVWVTSAELAIARAQTEHFDLVFMDLNMSDMDGFTATARIRATESGRSRVPIVALTAHDAHSYRERVLQAGMDDILSKPYTLQDCRTMLARWLPVHEGPSALTSLDGDAIQALNRMGSGGGLHARLVGIFEQSSRSLMDRLDTALSGQDLPQAADICHTLKSSSANVGAVAFAAKVRELEQHCRGGDAVHAAAEHRELAAAYEPLLAALQGNRMAASA